MKIITLTEEEFNNYAKNHKYRNYYQTVEYGNVMKTTNFNVQYIGFIDENATLIGASLILYKQLFLKHKYAYAPRGFLFDYEDKEHLKELTERIKKLLLKQGFIFLRLDPYIYCSKRDKNGEIISYNEKVNDIIELLNKLGYIHHGFNNYFENIKARWHAVYNLEANQEEEFKKLDKKTRQKINRASNNGIYIEKDETQDVKSFYDFIKKKHSRNMDYYQAIIDNFKDNPKFEIYYAKIDTEKFVINSKDSYEKELIINSDLADQIQSPASKGIDKRKIINKKMESDRLLNNYKNNLILATKLLKEYPQGFKLGCIGIIKYDNNVHMLIEGFNQKYRSLNPNYLLKWKLIELFSKEGYKTFDMNAIVGEFKNPNKYRGLNEMKLRFNSEALEFIGEFDIIINPVIYNIYNKNKKIKKQIK